MEALTKLPQLRGSEGAEFLAAGGVEPGAVEPELNLVAEVLSHNRVDADDLRHELRRRLGKSDDVFAKGDTAHRSDRSWALFARALDIARNAGAVLNSGHLFLAILAEDDAPGRRLLAEMGGNPRTLSEAMRERLAMPLARRVENEGATGTQTGTPSPKKWACPLKSSPANLRVSVNPVLWKWRHS